MCVCSLVVFMAVLLLMCCLCVHVFVFFGAFGLCVCWFDDAFGCLFVRVCVLVCA